MNRKWRMSCAGLQNIERDFFKFVMIYNPPHITLHLDSSRNNIQITDTHLPLSLDLPQRRNSNLPVLSVKYVFSVCLGMEGSLSVVIAQLVFLF